MPNMTPKTKWYSIVGGVASCVGILVAWFTFAGFPPYASAQSVVVAQSTARTALQQAWENKVDAQQRRVNDQRRIIDERGSTPERQAVLRRELAQLSLDRAERDRKYK